MSADLQIQASDRAAIEAMSQDARELLIASNLDQAKAWLDAALAVPSPDPRTIADYRIQIAAVEQMARQLRVSRELQVDAQAMVRRAERGVGLAIRKGQEDGTIMTQADGAAVRSGDLLLKEEKVSSSDFFPSSRTMTETYALTDNVTDEQFEQALDEAKEEGNVSRANVVRKVHEVVDRPTAWDRWDEVRDLAARGLSVYDAHERVDYPSSASALYRAASARGIRFASAKTVNKQTRFANDMLERTSFSVANMLEGLRADLHFDYVTDDTRDRAVERLIAARTNINALIRDLNKGL